MEECTYRSRWEVNVSTTPVDGRMTRYGPLTFVTAKEQVLIMLANIRQIEKLEYYLSLITTIVKFVFADLEISTCPAFSASLISPCSFES